MAAWLHKVKSMSHDDWLQDGLAASKVTTSYANESESEVHT